MEPTKVKGYKGSERRKFPRARDNIFVFCQSKSSSKETVEGITKDIGGGGLAFETDRSFPLVANDLDLEIYQPLDFQKTSIASIFVKARIAWLKEIEGINLPEKGSNRYKVGIEFIEIKEEDRDKIIKYIEERLREGIEIQRHKE